MWLVLCISPLSQSTEYFQKQKKSQIIVYFLLFSFFFFQVGEGGEGEVKILKITAQ